MLTRGCTCVVIADACRGWEPGDFVQFTNPGFAAIAASTENPPDFLARILGEVEGHQHGPAGPLLKLQLYEEIVYGCGRSVPALPALPA